jgi:hypothetical protein
MPGSFETQTHCGLASVKPKEDEKEMHCALESACIFHRIARQARSGSGCLIARSSHQRLDSVTSYIALLCASCHPASSVAHCMSFGSVTRLRPVGLFVCRDFTRGGKLLVSTGRDFALRWIQDRSRFIHMDGFRERPQGRREFISIFLLGLP